MCVSIISGVSTIFNVFPLRPSCPPGLRPVLFRKLWLRLGRFSSFEGGIELLLLFFGCSYFARRCFKWLTSVTSSSILLISSCMIRSLSNVCFLFYKSSTIYPLYQVFTTFFIKNYPKFLFISLDFFKQNQLA